VCVSVCVCVCRAVTFDWNDLLHRYLAYWLILKLPRSSYTVKVMPLWRKHSFFGYGYSRLFEKWTWSWETPAQGGKMQAVTTLCQFQCGVAEIMCSAECWCASCLSLGYKWSVQPRVRGIISEVLRFLWWLRMAVLMSRNWILRHKWVSFIR